MLSSLFAGLVPSDEELGKKDDDHRSGEGVKLWSVMRSYLRVRKRRLAVLAIAIFTIWFLFTHRLRDMLQQRAEGEVIVANADGRSYHVETEATTNFAFPGKKPAHHLSHGTQSQLAEDEEQTPHDPHKGKKPSKTKHATQFYYEGNVKFYDLPASIRSISRTRGWSENNRNVLFAAADLRSVAILLPIACDMAKRGLNHVHMAFMGRNDLSIEDILQANGLDKQCHVFFHDARPDYAPYSSDLRAESSVASALKYIHEYMHPQVIVTHSPQIEDDYFTRAVGLKAMDYHIPVIQIPEQAPQLAQSRPTDNLGWITRLEAISLASWGAPDIEILIQAPTGSSGPLIRLLDSLWNADYTSAIPPRLTLELSAERDHMLEEWLSRYMWPPGKSVQTSEINLRRRIPIRSMTAEEASVRLMESFYPSNSERSHVLLLSPNAFVSPLYYQQLRYYLLSLKYTHLPSTFPPLMGIALNIPSVHLNGSEPFMPPDISAFEDTGIEGSKPVSKATRPHFLWEAPNTDAALIFGSAWKELHSFLSLRLAKYHAQAKPQPRKKLVNVHMPSWAEYLLEFMRARGYSFFYPGGLSASDAFVVAHKELERESDEFHHLKQNTKRREPIASESPEKAQGSPQVPPVFIDPFLPPEKIPSYKQLLPVKQTHPITPPHAFQPLINTLPFRGLEPSLFSLPHLAWDGALIPYQDIAKSSAAEAENFRQEIGGCRGVTTPKGKRRKLVQFSAEDLFCFGDEKWEEKPWAGDGTDPEDESPTSERSLNS